ncbi:unnamed protein product [Didymodactylos carnosus]|uniref:Reverse transcriptase/retrotransposon-derived protein RNase H-like domain-containing protein n=1 Tax=Didymodactylos carnosus TaxID=1234261 RepID=A0A815UVS7_9BILA|nr:unnamed protein product [Didymodactylos carnosus]CAF4381855.1 unnamed protein product [Didymodactylos carnosus]
MDQFHDKYPSLLNICHEIDPPPSNDHILQYLISNVKRLDLMMKLNPHEHLDDMVNTIENIEHRQTFKKFLQDYRHLFDTSKIIVAKTEVSYLINTKTHSPPCSKCYTMSKKREDALYDVLVELIKTGLISKAKSPYAAPAPLHRKEHLAHIQKVLECLNRNNLKLNPLKCSTAQTKISYLGHTITASAIIPLNDKINAILRLKEPRTLKEANQFIGVLSSYRKFIPRFPEVAAPIHAITNLTTKNRHKFKCEQKQSKIFYELNKMLTTAPLLLQFPDDSKPLILSGDIPHGELKY